ncbi:MAG: type II toxin-antitoxin system Phd/YefM family antitoxin [Chloroflexota bacterium]|jgi:prevent-host-death family protein
MREKEPVVQTVKASEAREHFSKLINRVFRREARVIVEKSGIPVAAIVSVEDLRRLNEFEAKRDRKFELLDEIGEAFKDVPAEEIEREVAKAIAEVRQKSRRSERPAKRTA